ncbi:MAG: hypothetical protein ACRDFB_07835, partial [Rhabdochlamydiaceae bacterium]
LEMTASPILYKSNLQDTSFVYHNDDGKEQPALLDCLIGPPITWEEQIASQSLLGPIKGSIVVPIQTYRKMFVWC